MSSGPIITGVEMTTYEFFTDDMGTDRHGFNLVYVPGGRHKQRGVIIQIHTDAGISGQFPIHAPPAWTQVAMCAQYLIGRDVTAREQIYGDLKRALRQFDMTGVGVIDICLWDIAGKLYNEPLYRLLGGTRRPLAAYASTVHGDENGGLSTPDQFADFAVRCRDLGYQAFKIHGWGLAAQNVGREIDNVLAVRSAVGDRMDLMLDPACELRTFGQALAVGRACDEANFFWLEDPYQDGGVATFSHRKLRQLIKTPLLQTEHVRLPEQTMNFAVADATDYVRACAYQDGGVTGVMKIAHAAEGLGLDVELHTPGPVHRHLMSAIRNTNYYELGLLHPKVKTNAPHHPVYQDFHEGLDSIDADGHVFAPEGPGLGVTLDWEWINAHRTDQVMLAGG